MVDQQIEARGLRDPFVLAAMRDVPRHLFVPQPYDRDAYADAPLPIGNGQTISQPYIVALMTVLIRPASTDTVLEIGAGSGYQAAILSELVRKVITIERIEEVAALARANLAAVRADNVEIVLGDGTLGYPPGAPYNGIIITAATPEIPGPLKEQARRRGQAGRPGRRSHPPGTGRARTAREPVHRGAPWRRPVCTAHRQTRLGGLIMP